MWLPSEREYTDEEHNALRSVSAHMRWSKRKGYEAGRGPASYATGDYWPKRIRKEADRLERLIPKLRRVADAMEREMARWP